MSTDALSNVDAAGLLCAKCGYDVRSQPADGICPECATPVAESARIAAVPLRPAWRDSDPRWRRRMLAGAWVMVMIPLLSVLERTGVLERVRLPVSWYRGDLLLRDSFVTWVYVYLVFCIGVVLFFSKERGRQPHRLDWTRRWGVIVSYLVLLLGVVVHGLLVALVMIGIGALFITLPPENQPAVTDLLITLSSGYLRFGPNDASDAVYALLMVCSAVAVLLTFAPL